jgi:hypothetical protein
MFLLHARQGAAGDDFARFMFQMRVFFFATCERVFVRDIMSFVTHVL